MFTDINRREGLAISATVVRCLDCGMRYLSPAPTAESLSRAYGDALVDPLSVEPAGVEPVPEVAPALSPVRTVARAANGLLRGHPHHWPEEPGRGRWILDFGCYDGGKLTYWHQRGWQVAGVDLNRQAIEVAARRFPDGRFWCGDLLSVRIAERFEVIRTDSVVEHLLDPIAYLARLTELLRQGGRCRVIVPNVHALSARLFHRHSYIYWMPFHLNLFSARTLRVAMERAGLVNVRCFTFTPIGSWVHTQRQVLLKPGFDRRQPSRLDRLIQRATLLNYPGESLSQWLGLGEELIATGERGA